jgi:hypothetical protein
MHHQTMTTFSFTALEVAGGSSSWKEVLEEFKCNEENQLEFKSNQIMSLRGQSPQGGGGVFF